MNATLKSHKLLCGLLFVASLSFVTDANAWYHAGYYHRGGYYHTGWGHYGYGRGYGWGHVGYYGGGGGCAWVAGHWNGWGGWVPAHRRCW